jgi:hypothetical protein
VLLLADHAAIGDDSTQDGSNTCHTGPEPHATTVFILPVPGCRDHGEAAIYGCLQYSHGGTLNHKTGEVVAGAHASEHRTPDDDAASDVLCRREDLKEPVVDWNGRDIAGIVDGSKQRILASSEAGILLEAHYSSIGEAVAGSIIILWSVAR